MVLTAHKATILFFSIFMSWTMMNGQTSVQPSTKQDGLPVVFILGEFDVQYENAMPTYKTLLEACNGNMESAFSKLTSMMYEMEAYSELSGYDLKGINAWMHFFWGKNGNIEHIGFHLKPNSKNVDLEEFKNFLNEFASNYRFPLNSKTQFAHYSSFSFPLNYPNGNKTAKNGN